MLLILIAFFLWLVVTLKDVTSCGYKVLLNPFFWGALFVTLYFIVPAFLVIEINHYFYWNLDRNDIFFSHVLVFLFSTLVSVFYFIHSSKKVLNVHYDTFNNISYFIKYLWIVILLYLIFALWISLTEGAFGKAFMYNGKQTDPFKLKNLAYLLIPLSTYLFWYTKRYIFFIPNVIIIVLDLVSGSRTVAMIVLIPIIINICVHKRKLYLVPGFLFLSGMLLLGVLRSDNVVTGVPWYINVIGEFRETYITLPLYITDIHYVGVAGIFEIAANLNIGILQPLRAAILDNYTFAGTWIANDIGRGYGLGSNLLTESLYYGYFSIIIVISLFITFMSICHKLMCRLAPQHALVLICFLIVILRLMIREGFYLNFGLLLFVFLFCWLPVFIILKIKPLFK